MLYDEKIEALISAALTDGVLTEKEKQVLFKKAQAEGIDLDEFEMVLDARLVELEKAEKEKAAASAPKSTKYGDVRKCPVCGAIVPALAVTCPECGYEFSNVETNFSSAKLYEQLVAAEHADYKVAEEGLIEMFTSNSQQRQQKIDAEKIKAQKKIIESFPVPMTKADLFDFMNYIKPHIKWGKLSGAYRKKMFECISKAKSLYSNDVDFEKLIANVEKDMTTRKRIILWPIIGVLSFVFVLLCILLLRPKDATNSASICQKEVIAYLDNGDFYNAKQVILNYKGNPQKIIELYRMTIENGIENGYEYDVVKLISNFETNTSGANIGSKTLSDEYKVNALIRAGRYEEAENRLNLPEADFWHGTSERNKKYYKFLSDCVSDMNAKGNKTKAKKFIDKKVSFFAAEPKKYGEGAKNEYYMETVRVKLKALVK